MADKITRCMNAAGFLSNADCNLEEARDHARMGLRKRTLVSLNRALDAARMAKKGPVKSAISVAISTAKSEKSGNKIVVKAIENAVKVLVDTARMTYRNCGATVDF